MVPTFSPIKFGSTESPCEVFLVGLSSSAISTISPKECSRGGVARAATSVTALAEVDSRRWEFSWEEGRPSTLAAAPTVVDSRRLGKSWEEGRADGRRKWF